jgi:electron transfer flavoprotein beta subunit
MMHIVAIIRLVPDLVEELEIDDAGTALDTTWLRLIINEFDDHALEQALLVKEEVGGQITVLAPDHDGIDDVLFTANAKGVDHLVKLTGDFSGANNHALARALAASLITMQPDLILTGVQANNDLDGAVGPLLAEYLDMPYVGYVAGITVQDGKISVRKEYPGGLIAEMDVLLPALIGIQAAEQPPRYVAVSKVRQAMKEATIQEQSVIAMDSSGGLAVNRMFQPEAAGRATMLDGDEEAVAGKLIELFRELGVK